MSRRQKTPIMRKKIAQSAKVSPRDIIGFQRSSMYPDQSKMLDKPPEIRIHLKHSPRINETFDATMLRPLTELNKQRP